MILEVHCPLIYFLKGDRIIDVVIDLEGHRILIRVACLWLYRKNSWSVFNPFRKAYNLHIDKSGSYCLQHSSTTLWTVAELIVWVDSLREIPTLYTNPPFCLLYDCHGLIISDLLYTLLKLYFVFRLFSCYIRWLTVRSTCIKILFFIMKLL